MDAEGLKTLKIRFIQMQAVIALCEIMLAWFLWFLWFF